MRDGTMTGTESSAVTTGDPRPWNTLSNNCGGLYLKFAHNLIPFWTREIRPEASGQLCFDEIATFCAANCMHIRRYNLRFWTWKSWRVEMSGEPVGARAKRNGVAPAGFNYDLAGLVCDFQNYGRPESEAALRLLPAEVLKMLNYTDEKIAAIPGRRAPVVAEPRTEDGVVP